MKVLHITNNYPTPNFPIFGIFVKEQIDSLSALGVENEVFFINGREKGKLEYVKSLQIKKIFERSTRYRTLSSFIERNLFNIKGNIRYKTIILSK